MNYVRLEIGVSCLGIMGLASSDIVEGSDPEWWSSGPFAIIVEGNASNDLSPANLGQAKHVTWSALEALRSSVPSLAEDIDADLSPLVDFTMPSPTPPDWQIRHLMVLNVGQLKALSAPFYSQIASFKGGNAALWLDSQLTMNQSNSGSGFPWTASTADDENYGVANLGQLKTVFALRFSRDDDSDGLSDFAEFAYFAGLSRDGGGDADGDSLSDRFEMLNQLDPSDVDSNDDGIPDGAEDSDDDGALATSEFVQGTDPKAKDNPAVKLSVVVGD